MEKCICALGWISRTSILKYCLITYLVIPRLCCGPFSQLSVPHTDGHNSAFKQQL